MGWKRGLDPKNRPGEISTVCARTALHVGTREGGGGKEKKKKKKRLRAERDGRRGLATGTSLQVTNGFDEGDRETSLKKSAGKVHKGKKEGVNSTWPHRSHSQAILYEDPTN